MADANVCEPVMTMAGRAAESILAKETEAGFPGGVAGTPITGTGWGQVDRTRSATAKFYAGPATGVRFELSLGNGELVS